MPLELSQFVEIYSRYGAPEELTSLPFKQFLDDWAVKNRLSSIAYPQSNCQVELAVKTAKRIINGNTETPSILDNDRAAQTILQYRNMFIRLSDYTLHNFYSTINYMISFHPNSMLYKPHVRWIASAQNHRKSLAQHNTCLIERYNCTTYTLCPLQTGDIVSIQWPTNHQCDITRRVIETLPNHQYQTRVDGLGRITLWNHRFLRKIETHAIPTPITSTLPEPPVPIVRDSHEPNTHVPHTKENKMASTKYPATPSVTQPLKIAHAISRLLP